MIAFVSACANSSSPESHASEVSSVNLSPGSSTVCCNYFHSGLFRTRAVKTMLAYTEVGNL